MIISIFPTPQRLFYIRQDLLGRLFGFSEVAVISISGDELDLWQNRKLQLKNANEFVKAFVENRV
jgi:hypothetical protein